LPLGGAFGRTDLTAAFRTPVAGSVCANAAAFQQVLRVIDSAKVEQYFGHDLPPGASRHPLADVIA
jgi:putative methionine-R-sulfoxide reductase with GAF domain